MANRKPKTKEWKENHSKMMLGRKHSEETKKKISKANKGKKAPYSCFKIGHSVSEEVRLKISKANKGRISKLRGKPSPLKGRKQSLEVIQKRVSKIMGENHPGWVKNREELKSRKNGRRCNDHKKWSRNVKKRDNNICKLNNKDCCGKIYSHHILSYKDYPELRYDINNGITLCKYHHPTKRVDEIKYESYFKQLINLTA